MVKVGWMRVEKRERRWKGGLATLNKNVNLYIRASQNGRVRGARREP